MTEDSKGLSRNGLYCLVALVAKGCAVELHGLRLEKRSCQFFEGPGSPAQEFGLIWWAVENHEVLADQCCAKDGRMD